MRGSLHPIKLSLKIQASCCMPSWMLNALGMSSLTPHHRPQRQKLLLLCDMALDMPLTLFPPPPLLLCCKVGVALLKELLRAGSVSQRANKDSSQSRKKLT